ncbi:MAG: AraC family transcriptional regulator [Deltaproteobacteria bacterium]|nr:AraC family transcriptional regulator [Deltaproteobacteria bacterium]
MLLTVKASTIPIFFAAGVALLMALEQLTRKKPNKANALFSVIFFCCYLIIQGAAFVANGVPPKHPLSLYLFFTAITLVGPVYYFYFNFLLHPEVEYGPRHLLHFVPAFIVFFLETAFQAMPLEFKQQWLLEMFTSPPQNALMVLVVLGAANAAAYLVYLLKVDLGLVWNVDEIKTELRLIVIINVLAIMAVVSLLVGFTFKLPKVFIGGGYLLALLTMGVFLGYNRYPHFLRLLKTEIEKKRYERSSLNKIDIDTIHDLLMNLVERQKIFTDTDLNLKSLAETLSLTPHQLSEYLNNHLETDFRSFINHYRVEEAKRLLLEDPERGVLDICFDVGFGSKSSFNAVFKKATGKTPSEYRTASSIQTA